MQKQRLKAGLRANLELFFWEDDRTVDPEVCKHNLS